LKGSAAKLPPFVVRGTGTGFRGLYSGSKGKGSGVKAKNGFLRKRDFKEDGN